MENVHIHTTHSFYVLFIAIAILVFAGKQQIRHEDSDGEGKGHGGHVTRNTSANRLAEQKGKR